MRTDVKVGLISVFAVVLAVVIYFVAQGNAHPRESRAEIPAVSPSKTPGNPAGTATTGPAAADVTGLNIASPTPATPAGTGSAAGSSSSITLAQAATPGNTSLSGGMIAPPSPSSSIIPPSSPAASATPGASASPSQSNSGTNTFTGNTPTGSNFTSPPLTGGVPTTPSNSGNTSPNSNTAMGGTSIIPPPSTRPSTFGSTHSPTSDNSSTITIEAPSRNTSSNSGNSGLGNSSFGSNNRRTSVLTPSDNSSHTSLTSLGSSTGGTTYTIQKGDMLSTIAKKFNVTIKAIEAANPGIDSTRLKINKPINIPATGSPSSSSSVTATADHAAPTAHSSRAATNTRTAAIHTPAKSSTSAKPGSIYVIKKGDTLASIAQSVYGNKNAYKRIFRANRGELANANSVPVGTTIRLPS